MESSSDTDAGTATGDIRHVLITGGMGFLGSHLVKRFLTNGFTVRAAGRKKPDALGFVGDKHTGRFEFATCDLNDPQLDDTFAGQDLVIHTAAITRTHSPEERRRQEQVNVEMTRNAVDACRKAGVPRLIHVSTTAAIGISPDKNAPADESFRYNLDELNLSYNSSKRRAEQIAIEANGSGLEVVVVNPGFIFGWHRERFRGGEVLARALRKSVVICTNGGMSIVHVDDVASGIMSAIAKGRAGERYILSGDNVTFREIAETVCRLTKQRRSILTMPDAARNLMGKISIARSRGPNLAMDPRYAYQFYSSGKARRELGYKPRSFESIVRDFHTFRS